MTTIPGLDCTYMPTPHGFTVYYNSFPVYVEKTDLCLLDRALTAKGIIDKINAGTLDKSNDRDAAILRQIEVANAVVGSERDHREHADADNGGTGYEQLPAHA